MTSKEALLKIEAFLAYYDFQEELQAIAKDLEVLEILKKLIRSKPYSDEIRLWQVKDNRYQLSNEMKLLKERLENESNKR